MKYSIDKNEQYSILKLQEEKLDSPLSPALKSEFVTLNAEGIKNIIIDLSEVKYVDSSGLSALLVGNRIYSEDEGIFILASLNDHVMKLIRISQLNNVLNLLPTVEEAIDAVFLKEIESGLQEGDDNE
ncbi:MAG: STAS domain-containing protein [Cyclobacteriaceae bacterium]|jgi:anti-anti-sigma factor|nr:STAS domain-containing protein [Cyclobacteriaceae bacterium]MCK5206429.1 STAS domain-containing protein [Cyclobacteriaceae bacterium]MCK5278181.1 STAS domain-containing protein [Cyclobacteriaceae bacterium]MCK5367191.1 STAS domain-containing protein [Cyclobacteriaceae bacterium]MCK5468714.1 STAS domain-containing protein [Cyclobacteriaceae bacterium]